MPHQHHFLSRLDRLTPPQVETALALYRDPALVKWVLANVKLPDGAPRVAISLDDPARGPFLVVTREGIFVTALGRDMSPGDLPVVTRGQLDAQLAARVDYKARVDVFLQVAGERGGSEGVFVRLLKAGENLSREEMTALSAVQPIYEFSLFKMLVESVCHLDDVRTALLPILRRAPKLRKTDATLLLLRSYWRTAFLVGHLSVLTGMSGPKLFDRLPEELHEPLRQGPMSWGGFRQGVMVHAVRALWLSARLGRVQVGLYKDRLPGSKSPLTAHNTVLSLLAIAFRHSRYRAEIEKLLRTTAESATNRYLRRSARMGSELFELTPEQIDTSIVRLGRAMVHHDVKLVQATSPFAFQSPEDVPPDLARTMLANANNSFIEGEDAALPLYLVIPWVARAEPEDLYLPRAYIDATRAPWEPEATYGLL